LRLNRGVLISFPRTTYSRHRSLSGRGASRSRSLRGFFRGLPQTDALAGTKDLWGGISRPMGGDRTMAATILSPLSQRKPVWASGGSGGAAGIGARANRYATEYDSLSGSGRASTDGSRRKFVLADGVGEILAWLALAFLSPGKTKLVQRPRRSLRGETCAGRRDVEVGAFL